MLRRPCSGTAYDQAHYLDHLPSSFWVCVSQNSLTAEQAATALASKFLEAPHYLQLDTIHGNFYVLDAIVCEKDLWILIRPSSSVVNHWYEKPPGEELFNDVRDRFCYLMSI